MWPKLSFARKARSAIGFLLLGVILGGKALGSEALPDFDHRYDGFRLAPLSQERQAAHKALQDRVPGAKIKIDPLLGSPAWIISPHDTLSGPHGQGKGISPQSAQAFDPKDPHHAIKAHLLEHRKLYGHGPEVLATARKTRDYISSDDGSRMVYWEQQLDGIPVDRAKIGANVSARGELLCIASTFVPDADAAATAGSPRRKLLQRAPDVSARQALAAAIRAVQEDVPAAAIIQTDGPLKGAEQRHDFKAGRLPGFAQTSLVWVPMTRDRLRLCWAVEVTRRERGERFRVLVDAENGQVIARRCLTFDISDASYLVYTGESPSPLSPTWPTPSKVQPDLVPPQLVTFGALNTNASPLGWIPDGANETRGNNVDAYLDRDADDLPDLPRVSGNPPRVFAYTNDLTQSPTNYGAASVVQLFYWCNWIHDRLWEVGFTATNGNFQKDKFGVGIGGDPVLAEAQDGSGFNNANFTPTPEGTSPRIQIYLFNGPTPWRDAALDASVVLHEYTHGMEMRLVGGGMGINNGYQPFGLAEGWSDFVAQTLLSKPEDDPDGVYACGGYSTYKYNGLQENYYFGIRRYPYTTQTQINPLSFRHIYRDDVSEFPNIPRNPVITSSPLESHRMGEVWCSILWEMRAALIHQWGYQRGNDMTLRLVRRGMEMSPQNPNFVDARNAIQAADAALYRGTNAAILWTAFAKRGLGVDAETVEIPFVDMSLKESTNVPPPLNVLFPQNFQPQVNLDQPFTPMSVRCTLNNKGQNALGWHVETSDNWLTFVPSEGALGGYAWLDLIISLNTNAMAKSEGFYTNTVVFVDQTSGQKFTNHVTLQVVAPPPMVLDFPKNFSPVVQLGQPFTLLSNVCTLSNQKQGLLDWHVETNDTWLTFSPPWGALGGHATQTVSMILNSNALSKAPGTYKNTVIFVDQTSTNSITNELVLYVLASEVVAKRSMFQKTFPLDFTSYTFTWESSSNIYSVCKAPATQFPVNPEGGEELTLLDDCYKFVTLTNGAEVSICSVRSNSFFIGSNGDIPFTPPSVYTNDERLGLYRSDIYGFQPGAFLESVRAGGFYDDLNPAVGGRVSWKQLSDRVAVTYENVPQYHATITNVLNNFQMELFYDGKIRFTYCGMMSTNTDVIAEVNFWIGISQGNADVPFVPPLTTDLAASHLCGQQQLVLPSPVFEGQGPVTATLYLSDPGDQDAVINLLSSDTNVAVVPASLTLQQGQTQVQFQISLPDDGLFNGSHLVTITALRPDYEPVSAVMQVLESQQGSLSLTVPDTLTEGAGLLPGAGRITLDRAPDAPFVIGLSSSDPWLLGVPETVTIPEGDTSTTFDIYVLDDEAINPTRDVLVRASVTNLAPASQTIAVLDNESRQITVTLPAHFLQTSSLHPSAGRIDIQGTLETNLLVALTSDLPGILQLPATVFIPQGLKTAYFDVTILDASQTNDIVVNVTASADGFIAGSSSTAIGGIAVPSVPASPTPADGATKQQLENLSLSWGTLQTEWPGTIAFEIYFGTNPVLRYSDLLAITTDTNWPLERLAFGTTYYWQVVSVRGTNHVPGPVWRFNAIGLSHFDISPVSSPQALGDKFQVTVTAKDENFQTATNFSAPVTLRALAPVPMDSILITEIVTLPTAQVEFANVSDHDIEISGWRIILYDWVNWPDPRASFTIPGRVVCPANGVFVLQRSTPANYPGAYPLFNLGQQLSWNVTALENPISVLVLNNADSIIDFLCANDADPTQITNPIAIPREQWIGSPVGPNLTASRSMQRMGRADHNRASDWTIATTNMGVVNPNLIRPFVGQRAVSIFPGILTNFVNGVWSGEVKVLEVAAEVALQVDDGGGHFGTNGAFAVTTADDLSLQAQGPANIPRLTGGSYSYVLTVSNTGPASATGVWLRDRLPAGVTFYSANSSQGTCTANEDGILLCNLGALGSNATCSVSIAVTPILVGSMTNFAEVWCAEGERYLQNNSVATVTRVDYPWLSIGAVARSEGNTTNIFSFPVRLSDAVSSPVTVRYYTSNGTAVAGVDYVSNSGTLTFSNGVTSNVINVTVLGNLQVESNKTFFVCLDEPVNAIVVNSPGQGTIQNDDFFFNGSLTVWDSTVVEGNDGVANAVFLVTMSQAQAKSASVYYETLDGTATAGLDYVPTWGRLEFPPGVTNGTITVGVLGDRVLESNETFYVKIAYADSLYVMRQGVGTILDDDSDVVDHFAWIFPGTNQWIKAPFNATLQAIDGAGRPATYYTGQVSLLAGRQSQQITIGTGTNLLEYPFGAAYQDSRVQVLYPAAEIGRAGRITAVALRLATLPGQTLHGWTLRMKPVPQSSFNSASSWEDFETAPVFQGDKTFASGGWVTFPLQNPFAYDGTNSLLVDFSFNNEESSSDGLCFATTNGTNQKRAMGLRTDGYFGDPLSWVGAFSAPWTNLSYYPNIRLTMDTGVGIGVTGSQSQNLDGMSITTVNLVNGAWSGDLSLDQSRPDVILVAQDNQGHVGTSGLLRLWPRLTVERLENSVRISFRTSLGGRYQIESTDRLGPLGSTTWTPISAIIEGDGGVYYFTNSVSDSTYLFYRVNVTP